MNMELLSIINDYFAARDKLDAATLNIIANPCIEAKDNFIMAGTAFDLAKSALQQADRSLKKEVN